MECVESVCRAPFGDGLVAIFECFGRIILDVVGMFICPLMDILLIFLDFIIDVFNVVLDVFRSLNDFIEDDLAGVFEDIESFCDAIIRPDFCIDLPSPIPDACVDLDFDIPNDDNDNDLCSVISLTVDLRTSSNSWRRRLRISKEGSMLSVTNMETWAKTFAWPLGCLNRSART
jgi:hypothetical protein